LERGLEGARLAAALPSSAHLSPYFSKPHAAPSRRVGAGTIIRRNFIGPKPRERASRQLR